MQPGDVFVLRAAGQTVRVRAVSTLDATRGRIRVTWEQPPDPRPSGWPRTNYFWVSVRRLRELDTGLKPTCMMLCHQLRHPCALCKVAGCLRKA